MGGGRILRGRGDFKKKGKFYEEGGILRRGGGDFKKGC